MNIKRILAIVVIFFATTLGWFILGTALAIRTETTSGNLHQAVADGWGPPLAQKHPETWYLTPGAAKPSVHQLPEASAVRVELEYDPKKRGLMWYRTFTTKFSAEYQIGNPSPVTQTVYVRFRLPSDSVSYTNFSFRLGDAVRSDRSPVDGAIVEAISLPPGGTAPLRVEYETRGSGSWQYGFGENSRITNFQLALETNFDEIDFPVGTASPTSREKTDSGWALAWDYPDVLSARGAGMEMPAVLNAGPVASRITFFAPVGLLFFFAVVLILGSVSGNSLHPMNYFFLAAGFFSFQLLFAYLVDVSPLLVAFVIASAVSLALVGGYIHATTRGRLTRVVLVAQFAYMVLFSYSFFFEGLTGLTITIGAVITLAILMRATAGIDWSRPSRGTSPTGAEIGGVA